MYLKCNLSILNYKTCFNDLEFKKKKGTTFVKTFSLLSIYLIVDARI